MIQALTKLNNELNSLRFAFILIGITFLGLFAATWYTIKVAMAGHEAVIDANYYEKGLNYEKEIAESRKMNLEGYKFESRIISNPESIQKGINTIKINLMKENFPVNNAKVFVTRERTATNRFTERKELIFIENGTYENNLEFPELGQWQVTLNAKIENRNLEKTFTVFIK